MFSLGPIGRLLRLEHELGVSGGWFGQFDGSVLVEVVQLSRLVRVGQLELFVFAAARLGRVGQVSVSRVVGSLPLARRSCVLGLVPRLALLFADFLDVFDEESC